MMHHLIQTQMMNNLRQYVICHVTLIISLMISMSLAAQKYDISSYSLEEKIGQLMMISFEGTTVPQDVARIIREKSIGGIIYYRSNCTSGREQVQQLSADLQNIAQQQSPSAPLLIAIDQEGGRITRLTESEGFTRTPSQQLLGLCDVPLITSTLAQHVGNALHNVGINTNFAPVADVISGPQTVIGDRSFSEDPHKVSRHVFAALEGYRAANIAATLKHFPGHGSTPLDSHEELPTVNKTYQALLEHDLIPFIENLNHAPLIMTAHIRYSQLDSIYPATISRTILHDILRKKLKYKGVIISDSLTMKGILAQTHSLAEAAIQALIAGCDILLFGKQQLHDGTYSSVSPDELKRIHTALVAAVREGRVPLSRVDRAVERVSKLKSNIAASLTHYSMV
jgi:beta-N-acetylhexosaminidase